MMGSRLLALAMLAALACGGGGGGGGGPTQPQPVIAFTAASGSESANFALVEADDSSATLLRLRLVARNVSGLYGVAFDLVYPGQALTFARVVEGTFLGGGSSTSLQVNSTTSGRIIVGLSRLGAVGGVSGSGTLLTLEFSPGTVGSGSLGFQQNRAFNSAANPIGGLTWAGGSVAVTQ